MGGKVATLPDGFQAQSPDAAKVYGQALAQLPPQAQMYLQQVYKERPGNYEYPYGKTITAQTAEDSRGRGTYTKLHDLLAANPDGSPNPAAPTRSVENLYTQGPWPQDRSDIAVHELAHTLTENAFAGAPPGTIDMVLDRLNSVGRNTPGFEDEIERAYPTNPNTGANASSVVHLSSPQGAYGFENQGRGVAIPSPMHEYFASLFNKHNRQAPNNGIDAQGRKWDAKGLLESLMNYQMYGP